MLFAGRATQARYTDQCWLDVGPGSVTVDQHWTDIVLVYRAAWVDRGWHTNVNNLISHEVGDNLCYINK